jgi:hypothetical protein
MTLYKNDLNYTFGKILFLIVVIITYMYCFKVTGIIQPLMVFFEKFKMGVNTVSDKINKEIPKIKEKIPEIKNLSHILIDLRYNSYNMISLDELKEILRIFKK